MSLNISINKPVVVLKVHSTGRNTDKDRIVQLSVTKYQPEGEPISNTRFINPTIPIPADVSEYHGITDEDVADAKTFAQVASKLAQFIGDADILGFGITFDVSILMEEFNRAGVQFSLKDRRIINLSEIYNKLKPRDVYSAIEEFTGQSVKPTRTFSADEYNRASVAIFNGMIDDYGDKEFTDRQGQTQTIEKSIDSIHDIFSGQSSKLDFKGFVVVNKDGRPVFNFGKHRGEIVSDLFATKDGQGYYDWIINKGDYPQDTKDVFTDIFNSVKNQQESATI